MGKRTRRAFNEDFKKEAVTVYTAGERSVAQVAKELGLPPTSLRNWVREAKTKAPAPTAKEALSTAERDELVRLRKENKQLEMERAILKKATAFFARENA
jgi:transposase